jgi:hypothetical protein
MSSETFDLESRLARIKGRESRTQSIATRFTRTEEKALLKEAAANSQNLREWAREVLLRADGAANRTGLEMHIFAELVGIQMLLMDTLEPLLRGDKLAQEQIKVLFRQIQTTKAAKAQEILAKRIQKQEK